MLRRENREKLDDLVSQDDEIWIPLREAAEGTPYSQDYLSLLARKGRLEAIKQGRNWYTTRLAVQEYMRSIKKGE